MPLAKLFRRSRVRAAAHELYGAAVRQAREPGFYTRCGVADSLDGRFDMIVLHVFLLLRSLRRWGEPGTRLSQAVFNVMFDDMDQSLRESGVGDLGVGKRVKAMAQAFYGRCRAYEVALEADGTGGRAESMTAALRRNIYGAQAPSEAQLDALTAYVRELARALEGLPEAELLAGRVRFIPAPAVATAAPAPSAASVGS